MLKSILCWIALVIPNGITTVTEPVVKPVEIVKDETQGLTINGPGEVVSGDFLILTIDGVESKVVDGVRVPGVRVAIDPPTKNLIREDNGYRLYLGSALAPNEKSKVFLITVAVNNPDPNELPLMTMRKFTVLRGLEPEIDPTKPVVIVPNTPENVPEDRFDNLGIRISKLKAGLDPAKLKALSELYETTATKVENLDFVSVPQAQKALIASRDWNFAPQVAVAITDSWNKNYETFKKADYVEFCRAVAKGLK